MEEAKKNEDRIVEIEKRTFTNKNEEKQNLEARFANEKETFNATSELKVKIEELKNRANIAKENQTLKKLHKLSMVKFQL